jgi:hypothetical protein
MEDVSEDEEKQDSKRSKGKGEKSNELGCLSRNSRTARNKPNLKYIEDFALEGSTERHDKEEP